MPDHQVAAALAGLGLCTRHRSRARARVASMRRQHGIPTAPDPDGSLGPPGGRARAGQGGGRTARDDAGGDPGLGASRHPALRQSSPSAKLWVRLTPEDIERVGGEADVAGMPRVREVAAREGVASADVWARVRSGELVAYRAPRGRDQWEWRLTQRALPNATPSSQPSCPCHQRDSIMDTSRMVGRAVGRSWRAWWRPRSSTGSSPWRGSPTCSSAWSRAGPRPTSSSDCCRGRGKPSGSPLLSMLEQRRRQMPLTVEGVKRNRRLSGTWAANDALMSTAFDHAHNDYSGAGPRTWASGRGPARPRPRDPDRPLPGCHLPPGSAAHAAPHRRARQHSRPRPFAGRFRLHIPAIAATYAALLGVGTGRAVAAAARPLRPPMIAAGLQLVRRLGQVNWGLADQIVVSGGNFLSPPSFSPALWAWRSSAASPSPGWWSSSPATSSRP